MHGRWIAAVAVVLLVPRLVPAGEWEVTTEPVATITYNSTNIATIWGYHQPLIVRHGDAVYCALLEPYGDGYAQQWSLYARDAGGWRRVWRTPPGPQLNQPPSLVADPTGDLHIFAWPDGLFTHWHFAAAATGLAAEPVVARPPTPYNDMYPYAGAAANAAGQLLVVTSSWSQNQFALWSPANASWARGVVARHPQRPDSPSGHDRQAYPLVALEGRAAHVFTTQDIADSAKIAAGAGFVYSFRNLHYFHTPDVGVEPFSRTTVIDMEPQGGWVHNDDLLVDAAGTVHLLYQYQPQEGDWPDTRTVHAFGPPGGPFQHVQLGAPGEFNSGRLWESPDGVVYTVQPRFIDLHVAPLGPDGDLAATPADLGISSTGWGYFGRCFLAGRRSSASGAPHLEGLYFTQISATESEVRYFRATLRPSTAVVQGAAPERPALGLAPAYPNPFNAHTEIPFTLQQAGRVELAVRDLLGRPVRVLVRGERQAGPHRATWNGQDEQGRPAATGVYLLRLVAGGQSCLGKVLLVR